MYPTRRPPPFYTPSSSLLSNTILVDWPIQNRLTTTSGTSERTTNPSLGYQSKVRVIDRYKVIGFISSGTYGRVLQSRGP